MLIQTPIEVEAQKCDILIDALQKAFDGQLLVRRLADNRLELLQDVFAFFVAGEDFELLAALSLLEDAAALTEKVLGLEIRHFEPRRVQYIHDLKSYFKSQLKF